MPSPKPRRQKISPHQALVYAMILVAGSDRDISGKELKLIGRKSRQLPVFAGFDDSALPAGSAESSNPAKTGSCRDLRPISLSSLPEMSRSEPATRIMA